MGNFKIREFRKAKGLYQDQMAQIVGLTQSNLSRYETNDLGLTDAQLDKLRAVYGKEEVDAYMTDGTPQPKDNCIPECLTDGLAISELVNVVKKQNDTICQQIELQNQFTRQLTSMHERLLNLLEKVSFG